MKRKINILHLSDLHFGAESKEISPTASAQRENALKALQVNLNELENEWKPNIVVISGDIGWKGHENDYKDAKIWLESLLKALDLTANDLVLAAGNHDIEIKATTGMNPPTTQEEADKWLKIENLENFIRPFDSYTTFHKTLGIPDLLMGDSRFQIIGCRELKEIEFVVLNSAWFSRGNNDKDNLWIGLPQLEVLRSQGCLLEESNYNQSNITIAVLHHPEACLNEAERHSYKDRPNSYGFLSKGCHIILSGHTHSTIEPPDRKYNHAYLFTGGSTYTDSDYRNNFSILQIDIEARTFERKAFEFDPRHKKWVPRHDDTNYPLSLLLPSHNGVIRENELKMKQTTYNYNLLRERAKDYARRYIEQKSRTIARTTALPKIIERKVAVHNREEKIIHRQDGTIHLNARDNLAPFSEMVASVQPIFLFGDLGSGKSTLVGDYIVKLIEANLDLIPILIPARFFLNKEIDTAATLSHHVSDFVKNQIDTTQINFDLQTVLEDMQEVTLVIDGFDELDKGLAQHLLLRTEDLASHWSRLRAICTGRPIELRGLNYNNWQCLEMVPLTQEEQKQLFLNEAFAEGLEGDKAERDANDKMAFLELNPELLNIATTPLTIRLIRPHLEQSNQTKSIGDLLIDITQEQLGEWGEKDGKEKNIAQFKVHFPDSFSREILLGEIAAAIHNNPQKMITKESLYTIISNNIDIPGNRNLAISQGCLFFENTILQNEMDILTFPSHPIFQCALGYYIFFKFKENGSIQLEGDKKALWREYSFAACLARRKNAMLELRESFKDYIADILTDVGISPAAAIIISEFGDKELAQHFIKILEKFEFRPLRDFMDKNTADVAAYAHCFHLAGDIGFNWFYEEYLDPRYPYQMQWRNIEAPILTHWLIISDFKIKREYMEKLKAIPQPLIASSSFQSDYILPVIVLISPELFNAQQRALLYVRHLDSRSFKSQAISLLEKEFEEGNKDEVLKALETVCSKEENQNADAISLWLKLCQEKPPIAIIRNIIYLSIFKRNEPLYIELEKRLGEKHLVGALKWYLFNDSKISTAAALKLYDMGEKGLFLLGPGLLNGIHDGGKIEKAEYVLHQLIQEKGKEGLVWLLNQFPHSDGSLGPHSAYWRILMTELNKSEETRTDWFAFAIKYLGMITIPRYPEIRREFKKLLDNKPAYKDTLADLLKSLDREHRYNAACILLTCYPETELLAAEIVIKGVEIHGLKKMDEWIRFCLRLRLGKKVLEYISSIVESLHSYSKTFALTLLYHNGCPLSKNHYRDLVISLLDRSYTFDMDLKYSRQDDLPQILAQDKSFEILIEVIKKNNQLSQKAASTIWSHHKEKLEPQQYSHCLSLVIDSFNYWDLRRMDLESGRLKKDGLFRKQILSTTHQIKTSTGKEPIISIYLRAISETSAWKDVLWAAIFNDKFGHELEYVMLWLFDKGRKDSSIGKTIGSAAREFLSDPRVKEEKHYNERIPWLTFLAHEFGGLPTKEIENSLVNYRPSHKEITTALIARLGYVPDGCRIEIKDYVALFKPYDRIKLDSPGFEDIVNITREAESIHPDFFQWVERVLLSGVLQNEEIKEIALTGKFGCLFSVIISFCRDSLTDYDWIIRLIGIELTRFNRHDRNNKSVSPIKRARDAILKIIANDPRRKNKYFTRIKKAIKDGHHEEPVDLISELLNYREDLDKEIFSILLSGISEHPYRLNWRTSRLLAEYFVHLKKEQKTFVLSEIKKIVSTLSHRVGSHAFTAGMDEMLFSLAVFLLQGKADEESERVFLYGFQSIFIHHREEIRQVDDTSIHFRAKDILNAIEPLLKAIPRSIIKRCIKRGMHSNIPEISSFCRVLNALS